MTFVVLFLASLWAGIQNALAGGGSFITLPLLMLTGMDARAANVASTIALFPAQMATGWTGRKDVSGAAGQAAEGDPPVEPRKGRSSRWRARQSQDGEHQAGRDPSSCPVPHAPQTTP